VYKNVDLEDMLRKWRASCWTIYVDSCLWCSRCNNKGINKI